MTLILFLGVVFVSTVFTRAPTVRRYEHIPWLGWRKFMTSYLTYILEHRPDKSMNDKQLASLAPWDQDVTDICKNDIK